MKINLIAARTIVSVVAIALVLPACDTTKLKEKHSSFESCFREEKTTAMVIGGLAGGILGGVVAGGGKQGAVVATALAVVGAIVGQKMAWQQCLKAFPVKVQTTFVAPLDGVSASKPSQAGPVVTGRKFLKVDNVFAKPLVFGRDLEVSAQYTFAVDKPDVKDIKAIVRRNLVFVTPDGTRQEIESSSEDTIELGLSKTTFSIPTPSLKDAQELSQTRNWVFHFVVEADGMRSEVDVPLNVPELPAEAQASAQKSSQAAPSSPQETRVVQPVRPTSAATVDLERLTLPKATRLFVSPSSQRVVTRTKTKESAKVIQRKVVKGITWIQVQISTGSKGWIKGV